MNDGDLNSYLFMSNPALPAAVDAVGRADFYAAALKLIGSELDHDLLSLTRYTKHAPPDLISLAPDDFDRDAIQRYCDGLYVQDPFYRFWYDKGAPGVVTLQQVAPEDMWQSPYATDFLHDVRIRDEICVFLPPLQGASVALLVDRAHRDFSPHERERVERLFPLLSSLHALHVRMLLAAVPKRRPSTDVNSPPVRLVDGHGYEMYRAPTWPNDVTLGMAQSARLALSNDFVLAPGGAIEYIDDAAFPPPPIESTEALTPRERDIVRLTLEGYPTIAIAGKLGLAVGTVKNHRTRIFRKLDITTERELFLSVYGDRPNLI